MITAIIVFAIIWTVVFLWTLTAVMRDTSSHVKPSVGVIHIRRARIRGEKCVSWGEGKVA